MITRIFWFALLGAVALVTISVQLDRQSRKTPTLASSVPAMFRSSAQLPMAVFALGGEDPQAALEEAERLVARRPMPAEHLRVLAQAQFAAGEADASIMSIQYAAQRGWRDPLAQEAVLRLALENGNKPEAARRYAALFLRRDTTGELLEELGPAVLAEPGGEGRRTLIEIVGGGTRWHDQFLRRGARVLPPDAYAEIVTTSTASGSRFDCGVLRSVQPVLAKRDEMAAQAIGAIMAKQC